MSDSTDGDGPNFEHLRASRIQPLVEGVNSLRLCSGSEELLKNEVERLTEKIVEKIEQELRDMPLDMEKRIAVLTGLSGSHTWEHVCTPWGYGTMRIQMGIWKSVVEALRLRGIPAENVMPTQQGAAPEASETMVTLRLLAEDVPDSQAHWPKDEDDREDKEDEGEGWQEGQESEEERQEVEEKLGPPIEGVYQLSILSVFVTKWRDTVKGLLSHETDI